MDWRHIPSLSALRAFEACARYESLSGAAKALNVTHAAVSQHVRTLEARFGLALIERRGRGIGLTSEGVQLARGVKRRIRHNRRHDCPDGRARRGTPSDVIRDADVRRKLVDATAGVVLGRASQNCPVGCTVAHGC